MRKTIISAALLFASVPVAAQNISLAPSYSLDGFGQPSIATFGQTFTAPDATNLQSFQFYLGNDLPYGDTGADLRFRGYLMAWDATNSVATGPVLFQSAIASGNSNDDFAPYMFSTPGVTLTPGLAYVAFLSASGLTPANGSTNAVEQMAGSDDAYSGGSWVFADNGDDFGSLTSTPWSVADGTNAAFSAQFVSNTSSVPEPSEFVLLATGLTMFAGSVRFRRRIADA